jgi:hypothetical protein
MGFILKVYLLGLIAFVPSKDGSQMTILVVDAANGFTTSDGSAFPPHYPVLLASAGNCHPACASEVATIAPHLYLSPEADPLVMMPRSPDPAASLEKLVAGGGAWALSGTQIWLSHPVPLSRSASSGLQLATGRRPATGGARGQLASLPGSAGETADFSWVAEMQRVSPGAGEIDPDCMRPQPTRCPLAGRLTLNSGTFSTHKLTEYEPKNERGGVAEFAFAPLSVAAPGPGQTQAIADWTVVEIQVPTCEATFSLLPLDGRGNARMATLSPRACDGKEVVEVAMLNLPDPSQLGALASHDHAETTGDGSHFEIFYELARERPAPANRSVPRATGKFVDIEVVGQDEESSPLLERFGVPRAGTASRPICTQAVFAPL